MNPFTFAAVMNHKNSRKRKTFDQWMSDVNTHVKAKIGLSYLDLPDQPYAEWYENGKTAKSAAAAAVRGADE